jgi:hypothetical protein
MKDLLKFDATQKAADRFTREAKGHIWFTSIKFVSRIRFWHEMFQCHVERIDALATGFDHIRFEDFGNKPVTFCRFVEIPEGRNLDPRFNLQFA